MAVEQHPKGRVRAYVELLKRCSAPKKLVSDFVEWVEFDNADASNGRGWVNSLDDAFFHKCLAHSFSKPFDKDDQKAFFRPEYHHADPDSDGDTGFRMGLDGRLNEEQAFRRGFDQGFDSAESFVDPKHRKAFDTQRQLLTQWRKSRIWYDSTRPGEAEQNWVPKMRYGRTMSPKLRMDVFKRDGFRCVICGADAKSGASLEVDHKLAVSKGGTNAMDNLQTLCWACNSGKGDR